MGLKTLPELFECKITTPLLLQLRLTCSHYYEYRAATVGIVFACLTQKRQTGLWYDKHGMMWWRSQEQRMGSVSGCKEVNAQIWDVNKQQLHWRAGPAMLWVLSDNKVNCCKTLILLDAVASLLNEDIFMKMNSADNSEQIFLGRDSVHSHKV